MRQIDTLPFFDMIITGILSFTAANHEWNGRHATTFFICAAALMFYFRSHGRGWMILRYRDKQAKM